MNFVGAGRGEYILESGYKYVGYGGDFGRPRRDFTCLIVLLTLLSLLLLIPLLLWLFRDPGMDCETGFERCQYAWSQPKQTTCCTTMGRCCAKPVVLPAPVDDGEVDPFNCADDWNEWQAGWSCDKKRWCCNIHGKGCPAPPEGDDQAPLASSYDCNGGFANWVKGWSVNKKNWCCTNKNLGCVGTGALNMGQAASQGYGAGAQHGTQGAQVAAITGIVPSYAQAGHYAMGR